MPSNYGSSGSSFDQKEIFTFEDAARALVFDRTGQIVPALASRLTPLGNEFHDWIAVLRDAANADTNPLHISVASEEAWNKHGLKACVITREQLREWCNERGMRPKFLTPKQADTLADHSRVQSPANGDTAPKKWSRGLKLVAFECACAILREGKTLNTGSLDARMRSDERVTASGCTLQYSRTDASLKRGEDEVKVTTLANWVTAIKNEITQNS